MIWSKFSYYTKQRKVISPRFSATDKQEKQLRVPGNTFLISRGMFRWCCRKKMEEYEGGHSCCGWKLYKWHLFICGPSALIKRSHFLLLCFNWITNKNKKLVNGKKMRETWEHGERIGIQCWWLTHPNIVGSFRIVEKLMIFDSTWKFLFLRVFLRRKKGENISCRNFFFSFSDVIFFRGMKRIFSKGAIWPLNVQAMSRRAWERWSDTLEKMHSSIPSLMFRRRSIKAGINRGKKLFSLCWHVILLSPFFFSPGRICLYFFLFFPSMILVIHIFPVSHSSCKRVSALWFRFGGGTFYSFVSSTSKRQMEGEQKRFE